MMSGSKDRFESTGARRSPSLHLFCLAGRRTPPPIGGRPRRLGHRSRLTSGAGAARAAICRNAAVLSVLIGALLCPALSGTSTAQALSSFKLNERGYFERGGVNVMA